MTALPPNCQRVGAFRRHPRSTLKRPKISDEYLAKSKESLNTGIIGDNDLSFSPAITALGGASPSATEWTASQSGSDSNQPEPFASWHLKTKQTTPPPPPPARGHAISRTRAEQEANTAGFAMASGSHVLTECSSRRVRSAGSATPAWWLASTVRQTAVWPSRARRVRLSCASVRREELSCASSARHRFHTATEPFSGEQWEEEDERAGEGRRGQDGNAQAALAGPSRLTYSSPHIRARLDWQAEETAAAPPPSSRTVSTSADSSDSRAARSITARRMSRVTVMFGGGRCRSMKGSTRQ